MIRLVHPQESVKTGSALLSLLPLFVLVTGLFVWLMTLQSHQLSRVERAFQVSKNRMALNYALEQIQSDLQNKSAFLERGKQSWGKADNLILQSFGEKEDRCSSVDWIKPLLLDDQESNRVTLPHWNYLEGGNNSEGVWGRFAYRVYDVGSLLNVHQLQDLRSPESFDFTKIPYLDMQDIQTLRSWLNQRHSRLLTSLTLPRLGGHQEREGSNVFVSRSELIRFWEQHDLDPRALKYLTHYSFASAKPQIIDSSLNPSPTVQWGILEGGNDAFGQDSSVAQLPDLMNQRFPLEKMDLLKEAKLNHPLDDHVAQEISRLFGLTWSPLRNRWEYAETSIKSVSELSAMDPRFNKEIEGYIGPNFFEVLKAGILPGSLGQQLNNSGHFLGQTLADLNREFEKGRYHRIGMMGTESGGLRAPSHQFLRHDGRVDFHLMKIGACIIDQWDEDSFPTRLWMDTGKIEKSFYGVEDIPLLYGSYVNGYGLGYRPHGLGTHTVPGAKNIKAPAWISWVLQPMLWNPHAPSFSSDELKHYSERPVKFRVLANTSPVKVKTGVWPRNLWEKSRSIPQPADYRCDEQFFADYSTFTNVGLSGPDLSEVAVSYSNEPSQVDGFAYLGFQVDQSADGVTSFRDPQVLMNEYYPRDVGIEFYPDREDIPFNLLSQEIPFHLNQADTRLIARGQTMREPSWATRSFYRAQYDCPSYDYKRGGVIRFPSHYQYLTEHPFVKREFFKVEERQSVLGFRLGTVPLMLAYEKDPQKFQFQPNSNTRIYCERSSLHLEYLRDGEWLEYDVFEGPLIDRMTMLSSAESSVVLRADPRTDRWGGFPTTVFNSLSFAYQRLHNGFSPYHANLGSSRTKQPEFLPYLWAPMIGKESEKLWSIQPKQNLNLMRWFRADLVSLESLQWNDGSGSMSYRDPDGIQRRGISGDLLNLREPKRVGQPLFDRDPSDSRRMDRAEWKNYRSRPLILNRPFQSVAELGYAFRDIPWKHVDFMMPESGDTGLLELFSIREIRSPFSGPKLVEGLVDLNTPHAEVMEALLAKTILIEDQHNRLHEEKVNLTVSQREQIARLITQKTSVGHYHHQADLIGRYDGSGDSFENFEGSVEAIAEILGETDGRIKRRVEGVIRSINQGTSTGTMNILVDIVVETGDKKNGSFKENGRQRKWVCLSIAKDTGGVLSRFAEVVF